MICRKPDRHVPRIICGYPLPCPWHTVIIDPPDIILPEQGVNLETMEKLIDITEALHKK